MDKGNKIKNPSRLKREKDLLSKLIKALQNDHYIQNWHYLNQNWLPFIGMDFLHQLVTYRIPDLSDLDVIWNGFQENIKTDVRKASNNTI